MSSRWIVPASLLLCYSLALSAQTPTPDQGTTAATPAQSVLAPVQTQPPANPAGQPSTAEAKSPAPDRAWNMLVAGLNDDSASKRSTAVRVLSLLSGDPRALKFALPALADDKPSVRAAAAFSLGELHVKSSVPALEKALSDKDISVILAAANALVKFKDPAAYKIFYAVLTGEMKGGKGLIASQLDELKDTKQMALMGFQEGIGFIPYAGIGYDAYRAIKKDDGSPVRAAAARALIDDPDAITEDALVQATIADKSELVRNAALTAVARRGNSKLIERLAPALSDEKESVRYTAAAAIVHLDYLARKHTSIHSGRTSVRPLP
jgi:HEAT repeat protein